MAWFCAVGFQACGSKRADTHAYFSQCDILQKQTAEDTAFEPHALHVLEEMVEAYRKMPALDQKSVFEKIQAVSEPTAADTTLPPTVPPAPVGTVQSSADNRVTIRLEFDRPNKLFIEVTSPGETGKPTSTLRWVCDGKEFWSFNSDENTYTREDAPANIRDFSKLRHFGGVSMELSMLMGLNPFAAVKDQVDSVRSEGQATVGSVQTETIALRSVTDTKSTVTRLFIGVTDHLLHRLTHESSVNTLRTTPIPTGDPLDGLLRPSPASSPSRPIVSSSPTTPESNASAMELAPQATKVAYDNEIRYPPSFSPVTFKYEPPAGATRFSATSEPIAPRGKVRLLKDILAGMHHQKKRHPRTVHY